MLSTFEGILLILVTALPQFTSMLVLIPGRVFADRLSNKRRMLITLLLCLSAAYVPLGFAAIPLNNLPMHAAGGARTEQIVEHFHLHSDDCLVKCGDAGGRRLPKKQEHFQKKHGYNNDNSLDKDVHCNVIYNMRRFERTGQIK